MDLMTVVLVVVMLVASSFLVRSLVAELEKSGGPKGVIIEPNSGYVVQALPEEPQEEVEVHRHPLYSRLRSGSLRRSIAKIERRQERRLARGKNPESRQVKRFDLIQAELALRDI